MIRADGRSTFQMRPIRLVPHFTKNSLASVLIESGDTIVVCNVNLEENVPHWLRGSRPARGWLTAEYSMLPGATNTRTKRERGHTSGRSQEIQRLIGRSLRGVVDFTKCPDMTFMVDCDVIQADGGTRTAAITGSWVALKLAFDRLLREGRLKQNPLLDCVAAVSVGRKNGQYLVDLNYEEDSTADFDMNLVVTQGGSILELQGTGEKVGFRREEILPILDPALDALKGVYALQQTAAEGQDVEG